jgi:hypothetical protein
MKHDGWFVCLGISHHRIALDKEGKESDKNKNVEEASSKAQSVLYSLEFLKK